MRKNAVEERVWNRLDKFSKDMSALKEQQERTSRQIEETARQIKETDRQMKDTDRRFGRFVNSFGEFVESLVAPSLPLVMKERGIHVLHYSQNALSQQNGQFLEIDVLGYGKKKNKEEIVLLVEVKATVTPQDVKQLLKELEAFPRFFPEYKKTPRVGIIAGIKFPKDVALYAERNGLFVLVPSGNTVKLLNKKEFQPRTW